MIDGTKDEEDKKILNHWIIDSLKANPRLWFGGEGQNFDPRSQTEDLSDNSMKASEYGILNLKRILIGLPQWTKKKQTPMKTWKTCMPSLSGQFSRYMNHVTKNVGGIYETFKSVEQPGNVYEPTPKTIQKEAVAFLNKQLFETPSWLLDKNILNKFSNPAATENVANVQANTLNSLLSSSRLFRMNTCIDSFRLAEITYTVDELLEDVRKDIWTELLQ